MRTGWQACRHTCSGPIHSRHCETAQVSLVASLSHGGRRWRHWRRVFRHHSRRYLWRMRGRRRAWSSSGCRHSKTSLESFISGQTTINGNWRRVVHRRIIIVTASARPVIERVVASCALSVRNISNKKVGVLANQSSAACHRRQFRSLQSPSYYRPVYGACVPPSCAARLSARVDRYAL